MSYDSVVVNHPCIVASQYAYYEKHGVAGILLGSGEALFLLPAQVSSPFVGSTVGLPNTYSGCGKGPASMFYVILEPGQEVEIGITSDTFDSKQSPWLVPTKTSRYNAYT